MAQSTTEPTGIKQAVTSNSQARTQRLRRHSTRRWRSVGLPRHPLIDVLDDSQTSEKFCIPATVFARVVREIVEEQHNKYSGKKYKFSRTGLTALQWSAEVYAQEAFARADLLCNHRRKKTVTATDFNVAHRLYERRWFRK